VTIHESNTREAAGPVVAGRTAWPGSVTHSPESQLFELRAGLGGPTPPDHAVRPATPPARFRDRHS